MDLIEWAGRRLPADLDSARFEVSTLDLIRGKVTRSRKLGRRVGAPTQAAQQLSAGRVKQVVAGKLAAGSQRVDDP